MAIDVWAQITTPRMANQPWMQSLLRWTGQTQEMITPSIDKTLAEMDAAGVDMALLSAWHSPQGDLITNDEVSAQVDAAPDRFRGLMTVDLSRPMEAVREIRLRAKDKKFVGVRIVPWLWNLPPSDAKYYPVFAACVEEGLPFCTQIGHTGPLCPSEPGRLIPYLDQVLLDFPELKVVGGHLGFPWIDEVVALTLKYPNFYVDTSAYVAHRFPKAFVDFMKTAGRGRVMFGTNWPMVSPSNCLKHLAALELEEDLNQAFLSGTARKVFNLE